MAKKNSCCGEVKPPSENLAKVEKFLKIISEENRLQIIYLLRSGEKCVCEIYESLGIAQNLASHHLKVLKDFGLIESRKEGRKIIYFADRKKINKYINLINKVLYTSNDCI